jgi:Transglutaminase-like superfamily
MPAEDIATSYYLRPAVMTALGRYQPLLADLPPGIERRASVHVRPAAGLLERITAQDGRPLTTAREPAERLAGNCRHFTVLVVSMLRAQGTPARARCGFGGYFGTGMFEDHWVCEYWDESAQGWLLADAQIDDVQAKMFDVGFNLMNVPRDEFVVAGDAWRQCRAGEADPASFGFSNVRQAGYWWIAGNLIRDVAALSNMEMLPWDCWGAMPGPAAVIDDELMAFFDRVAELTRDPDATFGELTGTYAGDDRLRVPGTVYNAILSRLEPVLDGAPAASALSDFRQR